MYGVEAPEWQQLSEKFNKDRAALQKVANLNSLRFYKASGGGGGDKVKGEPRVKVGA